MEKETIIFQTNDSKKIEVVFEDGTVWLTQAQMAELFNKDVSGIGRHIKNVLEKDELEKESVCANFAYTAADGKTYLTKFYNLEMIVSVGNRVKYSNINQFKIWAEDDGIIYIDLFSLFADEEGKMDIKYLNDGLHLTGEGYLIWRDAVKRYL